MTKTIKQQRHNKNKDIHWLPNRIVINEDLMNLKEELAGDVKDYMQYTREKSK